MFNKSNSQFKLSLFLFLALTIGFFACQTSETFEPQEEEFTSLFKQSLEDNTQTIVAQDLGDGQYEVTGQQGTRVSIDNALINSAGERVRGDIDIVLIEIYSVKDMILNRKQTLADYDGQIGILESGGEIFIQAFQNGEELSADGNGKMNIYLPTENTGGPRYDMEMFYGEEVGEQVIWKPTGEAVKVVNTDVRNGGEYLLIIQDILGWINVDVLYNEQGEPVECIEVVIECPEFCEQGTAITNVALHLSSLNSAFELFYDPATGNYRLCGDGMALPLGGINVNFIVTIECPNGQTYVAIVSTTITTGSIHTEVITCDAFQQMDPQMFAEALSQL